MDKVVALCVRLALAVNLSPPPARLVRILFAPVVLVSPIALQRLPAQPPLIVNVRLVIVGIIYLQQMLIVKHARLVRAARLMKRDLVRHSLIDNALHVRTCVLSGKCYRVIVKALRINFASFARQIIIKLWQMVPPAYLVLRLVSRVIN